MPWSLFSPMSQALSRPATSDYSSDSSRRESNCEDQTARIGLLRTFRPANRFYNAQMRSKRHKVRGHRAIAQFCGVGRVVDDRYSARVSSSDCSRKAIVCQLELLNGGFRFQFAMARNGSIGCVRSSAWMPVVVVDILKHTADSLLQRVLLPVGSYHLI